MTRELALYLSWLAEAHTMVGDIDQAPAYRTVPVVADFGARLREWLTGAGQAAVLTSGRGPGP
jgi:hypothetical protein